MRDGKDIIKDFKICSIDGDCRKGCSYYDFENECCTEKVNELYDEVISILENNDAKDTWYIARLVANMDTEEFNECFGRDVGLEDVINIYKPEEIEKKIEEYENDFRVGDIVKFKDSDTCGVITKINHYVNILLHDGSLGLFNKDAIIKTEKRIDIHDVLNKLHT